MSILLFWFLVSIFQFPRVACLSLIDADYTHVREFCNGRKEHQSRHVPILCFFLFFCFVLFLFLFCFFFRPRHPMHSVQKQKQYVIEGMLETFAESYLLRCVQFLFPHWMEVIERGEGKNIYIYIYITFTFPHDVADLQNAYNHLYICLNKYMSRYVFICVCVCVFFF